MIAERNHQRDAVLHMATKKGNASQARAAFAHANPTGQVVEGKAMPCMELAPRRTIPSHDEQVLRGPNALIFSHRNRSQPSAAGLLNQLVDASSMPHTRIVTCTVCVDICTTLCMCPLALLCVLYASDYAISARQRPLCSLRLSPQPAPIL